MTPLERALRQQIGEGGPITLEAYMEACNSYYYATRDPLGARGDFTTAPEISQMFGELIGAALADCWKRSGAPAEAIYVELGPGRGPLTCDALRVMRGAGFDGEIHLVETSPVLREIQNRQISGATWHESVDDLPAKPLLLVANEFFDALPIRQHVGDIERRVQIEADVLTFDITGKISETSPAREKAAMAISTCLVQKGGAAIIIDYGHARSAVGDTLQAVRGHQFASVLADPGEQDLTSHVDFEALGDVAREAGAKVTKLVSQSDWLIRLGMKERAGALIRANPDRAEEVETALDRLTSASHMGELFKVISFHSPAWPAPAGF